MDYRGGQHQQQQQRDFHLSRSFFMRKRFSNNDNTLIFHKRFLYPLVISREKCLSYLKIKGFKTWKTPFLDTLLDPTKLSNDDYSLKISIGNNETTVFIPPLIFLSEYIGDIIIFIKKYINESLGVCSGVIASNIMQACEALAEIRTPIWSCLLFSTGVSSVARGLVVVASDLVTSSGSSWISMSSSGMLGAFMPVVGVVKD